MCDAIFKVNGNSLRNHTSDKMSDRENSAALDIYSLGWERGDSAIISRVLDTSYTFSGLPNMKPLGNQDFKVSWSEFRSSIEDDGGPKSESYELKTFKNVIRRKV